MNGYPDWGFLGAFEKFRKASSCLSAWNKSDPTGGIFVKFDIWEFFWKPLEKIKVSLKWERNNGYFTWRPIYTLIISRSILLRMRNVSDTICRGNEDTHFVFTNFIFNRVFYEIRWKSTVEQGRPQMTMWRMRIECWIPKAKNTTTICNTHYFSTAKMFTRTQFSVTLYVLCLSCYGLPQHTHQTPDSTSNKVTIA